jgi:hypothetical protein
MALNSMEKYAILTNETKKKLQGGWSDSESYKRPITYKEPPERVGDFLLLGLFLNYFK